MTYGDGRSLADDDIAEVYVAYNRASLALDWKVVDLAMLDNLRWAHARPAYRLGEGWSRCPAPRRGN